MGMTSKEERIEYMSNFIVDTMAALSTTFQNERINSLMFCALALLEAHEVLLIGGSDAPTLSFMVMAVEDRNRAVILLPSEWSKAISEDPTCQMGALVYISSQVLDYWNDKFSDYNETIQRAKAYEAEFLQTISELPEPPEFDVYQQGILESFPQGLDTPGIVQYESKEVPENGHGFHA